MNNVLIIGGSSTVGLSTINAFINNGANVIATYHNNVINIECQSLTTLPLNLNSSLSISNLILYIKNNNLFLDSTILLPSVLLGKNLDKYEDSDLEQVMFINFISQAKLIRELLPYFNKNSHIIMVSSISGQRGSFDPIYSASKAAILGFVKSMASSIRINAIAPGLIESSNMYNSMSFDRQAIHRSSTLSKQLLKLDDFAKIIVDLTKPHWQHLNGACIDINGGQYVR